LNVKAYYYANKLITFSPVLLFELTIFKTYRTARRNTVCCKENVLLKWSCLSHWRLLHAT